MPELHELPASKLNVSPDDSKAILRSKVWDYLEDSGLASHPKIPRRRISNFRGSEEACDRITELDVFKKAQILRIDPDRPLQEIRFKTLEAGKTLLVPTPSLKNHVFSKIVPPADCPQKLLRSCAARQGIKDYSEAIDIDEKVKVDAVVVGCVAVSTKGWRIGKGGGLSDLEYAMMASLGVVNQKVPIITMVHDCQILDLPDSLFGLHDLPVDYIVTPTQIIECTGHLPKPSSILWNLMNDDKLNHIPVLRRIRFRDWKEGKDVKLEGETENPTELTDDDSSNRRRTRNSSSEKRADSSNEERSRNNRYKKPVFSAYEGSIYAGSLPRFLRVSQFKTEVRERKVNPLRILWRGYSGFAFLNFKSMQDAEDALVALEGLHINDKAIKFEMAKSASGGRGRVRSSTNEDNNKKE
ncbi:hypothetical protein HELRODRAFT_94411 [Helobdella robusta]|uniref:Methenyltetrahydrofolate synthase domain-containing protein n=1 Tax=Helobdella robusta TaxID=6412 RepID=T1G909_HELRO|nr:hypothetical protein HELRODRAFT_94411 [Helobdella robusta]ESO02138.1 hypothetical protein HELRODRAFT_94411 [Helobdella robusta]